MEADAYLDGSLGVKIRPGGGLSGLQCNTLLGFIVLTNWIARQGSGFRSSIGGGNKIGPIHSNLPICYGMSWSPSSC